MQNPYVIERLGRQKYSEAIDEAERYRLSKQVSLQNDHEPAWKRMRAWIVLTARAAARVDGPAGSEERGRRMPDATGAGKVPSL